MFMLVVSDDSAWWNFAKLKLVSIQLSKSCIQQAALANSHLYEVISKCQNKFSKGESHE